jgi:hypothetical protein
MSDAALQSDFHFLEDVLRHVDGSKRVLNEVGASVGRPHQRHHQHQPTITQDDTHTPPHPMLQLALLEEEGRKKRRPNHDPLLPGKWKRMVQQAQDRKITLLLMPSGMERHKSNTSFHDTKSDSLHWKVEFSCHFEKNPALLTSHKLADSAKPRDELLVLLLANNMVIDTGDVHLLLKKLPCPSNQPKYVHIPNDQTLKEALTGMTVVEYPTIDVVLTKDLEKFPRMIAEVGNDDDNDVARLESQSSPVLDL